MSQTMLITGGAGFVGSNAARFFSSRGYEVCVLDNRSRGDLLEQDTSGLDNWTYLEGLEGVECVEGSVTNRNLLFDLAGDVDAILHTAGQTAVTVSVDDPLTDYEMNSTGTLNVLEAARRSDTDPSVLYCSTNKVYGENVNTLETTRTDDGYRFENDRYAEGIPETFGVDLTAHSPYGCSKLSGDLYAQEYGRNYGVSTGVFRMSCIYGPRQYGVEDQGWIAWFTLATLLDHPLTIFGDGYQVRDVLYVEDLLRAFESFLESDLEHGVWNTGGGSDNLLSLRQLLDLLETILGTRTDITYEDWRPSDQRVYISDVGKLDEDLDWSPSVSPEEGLGEMIEWMESHLDQLRTVVKQTTG